MKRQPLYSIKDFADKMGVTYGAMHRRLKKSDVKRTDSIRGKINPYLGFYHVNGDRYPLDELLKWHEENKHRWNS